MHSSDKSCRVSCHDYLHILNGLTPLLFFRALASPLAASFPSEPILNKNKYQISWRWRIKKLRKFILQEFRATYSPFSCSINSSSSKSLSLSARFISSFLFFCVKDDFEAQRLTQSPAALKFFLREGTEISH